MKTIWKVDLNPTGKQFLRLPVGSLFLKADMQYGLLKGWFLVDPDEPIKNVTVEAVMTGGQVPPHASWLDTVLLQNGSYVIHLFEVLE